MFDYSCSFHALRTQAQSIPLDFLLVRHPRVSVPTRSWTLSVTFTFVPRFLSFMLSPQFLLSDPQNSAWCPYHSPSPFIAPAAYSFARPAAPSSSFSLPHRCDSLFLSHKFCDSFHFPHTSSTISNSVLPAASRQQLLNPHPCLFRSTRAACSLPTHHPTLVSITSLVASISPFSIEKENGLQGWVGLSVSLSPLRVLTWFL